MTGNLHIFLENKYRLGGACWSDRVQEIEDSWKLFEPYADPNFLNEFCTDNEEAFQQRYWELFLGASLIKQGIKLNPNTGNGPDFSFSSGGKTVWIEAISPGPGENENRVPEPTHSENPGEATAQLVPATAMLLRVATGINKKLGKYEKYRNKMTIGPQDPFIIAIDCSQVDRWGFDGVSGFPSPLEAVYPFGAQQVTFDLTNPKNTTSHHQHRPAVFNANGAEIPTDIFLKKESFGISALYCASKSAAVQVYPPRPTVLIHNHMATNPIRPAPIFVDEEFHIEETSTWINLKRTRNSRAPGSE